MGMTFHENDHQAAHVALQHDPMPCGYALHDDLAQGDVGELMRPTVSSARFIHDAHSNIHQLVESSPFRIRAPR